MEELNMSYMAESKIMFNVRVQLHPSKTPKHLFRTQRTKNGKALMSFAVFLVINHSSRLTNHRN